MHLQIPPPPPAAPTDLEKTFAPSKCSGRGPSRAAVAHQHSERDGGDSIRLTAPTVNAEWLLQMRSVTAIFQFGRLSFFKNAG
jgi:hypothetical protein